MAMSKRDYNTHKKALLNRAMMLSTEGLQASIKDEFINPTLPYLVFDAMMGAVEKKLGRKAFNAWISTL